MRLGETTEVCVLMSISLKQIGEYFSELVKLPETTGIWSNIHYSMELVNETQTLSTGNKWTNLEGIDGTHQRSWAFMLLLVNPIIYLCNFLPLLSLLTNQGGSRMGGTEWAACSPKPSTY